MTGPEHHPIELPKALERVPNWNDFRGMTAEEVFEALQARAWIGAHRIADATGALDIQATADMLGIEIGFGKDEEGYDFWVDSRLEYKKGTQAKVSFSKDVDEDDKRYTFGVEIGLLFIKQTGGDTDDIRSGESHENIFSREFKIAQQFGREYALPASELLFVQSVDVVLVTALMSRYKVDHETALLQLMIARKLPRTVVIDSCIGETLNPLYSGKVDRMVVCLDCDNENPHMSSVAIAPIIDLTGQDFCRSTHFRNCMVGPRNMLMHRTINQYYDRWTEDDERMAQEQERFQPEIEN